MWDDVTVTRSKLWPERVRAPEFMEFKGSLDVLAASFGLIREDLDENLPVVFGSTGTWTLLIPIKKLESFTRITPHNELFPSVISCMNRLRPKFV